MFSPSGADAPVWETFRFTSLLALARRRGGTGLQSHELAAASRPSCPAGNGRRRQLCNTRHAAPVAPEWLQSGTVAASRARCSQGPRRREGA